MNYLSHFVSALCSLALSIIDILQYLLAVNWPEIFVDQT